ncbi:hypothetical protein LOZ61_006319 [Ophidiomyces ophidiicola]|nr:hypothetical protein LOZ61_006319 [Ophidiomyces ophidiicola]KAI1927790.1 hypothetical protein LOZ60_002904 [Ophidiomyces ophidiicola]KAI2023070.1 hypothetical protein LOZ48_006124 [Ophidiomyces ophidiicola]KAI2033550.1 hypothetical protein LOZ45_000834 [Ophidiomyces ophidiicola]KAI2063252.1 hypothetical protein LOZ40_005543 [Ophidiomyces ophidiicola]
MAGLPGIEIYPPTASLLVTEELRRAYERASHPDLQETATRPLFEEFLNEFLRNRTFPLSIYGEQQVDESHRRVDIAVGFHDPSLNLIFVLLCETKRNNVRDLLELEAQMQDYGDRYIRTSADGDGRTVYPFVFGATAYGTKIRFYSYTREHGIFKQLRLSENSPLLETSVYWDLRTDGVKIHQALMAIWNYRKQLQLMVGA